MTGNSKDNDKVVSLVPKSDAETDVPSELVELIGAFAAAVDAYEAVSFAAVAVTESGESITTFSSMNDNLLPLVGAVEGLKFEMINPVYIDEEY